MQSMNKIKLDHREDKTITIPKQNYVSNEYIVT